MGKWNSPNLNVAQVFQCLGHSNRTICTLLSQFCSCKFPIFHSFILGANSYYPREGKTENGKMEFSQPECESGISVPGAFKLDHLHPVKPILVLVNLQFFTPLYWGPSLNTLERAVASVGVSRRELPLSQCKATKGTLLARAR